MVPMPFTLLFNRPEQKWLPVHQHALACAHSTKVLAENVSLESSTIVMQELRELGRSATGTSSCEASRFQRRPGCVPACVSQPKEIISGEASGRNNSSHHNNGSTRKGLNRSQQTKLIEFWVSCLGRDSYSWALKVGCSFGSCRHVGCQRLLLRYRTSAPLTWYL